MLRDPIGSDMQTSSSQQTNKRALDNGQQQPDSRKWSLAPEAPKMTTNSNYLQQQMRVDIKEMDAANSSGGQEGGELESKQQHFKVSPLRWRILFGICVFGLCNQFSDERSSILNVYLGALDTSVSEYVYMSQMFFFILPVAGFTSATLIDRAGIKMAIYMALFYATVRNSARALLFATQTPGWHHFRWLYWALQNVFGSLTVAQYYTLPLRLAESWFPESERSLALNLIFGAPMLGTASAALLYPRYIADLKHASLLTHINLVMAATSIVAVSACVHRSKPREGAPSARNQHNEAKLGQLQEKTLAERLRHVLANKQYLLQVFVLSFADPLYWTVQGIAQDILISAGMSGIFCGEYLALSNIVGAFMQVFCSYLWIKKVRRRAEAASSQQDGSKKPSDPYRTRKCKWLLSIQCGLFLTFCYSLIIHELHSAPWLLQSQWWLLTLTSVGYIAAHSWAVPYYSEQTAELVCGTISEPTSSACQMLADSFMLNLLNIVFVSLRREQPAQGTHAPRAIYKWSVSFEMALAVASALLYNVKFAPNKRQQQQQQQRQQQIQAVYLELD